MNWPALRRHLWAVNVIVEQGRLSNKQVQKALKNAGYYTGPVDGRIGKKTRRAIKDFQKPAALRLTA
jgi:lysozyme family protein